VDQGESGAFGTGASSVSLLFAFLERGGDELTISCCSQVEALELKPVEKAEDVPVMVHGTYAKLWPLIGSSSFFLRFLASLPHPLPSRAEKEGLKVMTRNHIHCAVGLAGEEGITSGLSFSSSRLSAAFLTFPSR
jgi:hypothetical protein